MTRKRKIFLAIAGGLGLTIAGLALYLAFSDLSSWRGAAARAASRAMARELRISGEFRVDLGVVTRVQATDISLGNAGWASEPVMASIDRLDGEIDLRALLNGEIHLPRVDIEGGRALFESDPDAGSNWALGEGENDGEGSPVRLRIDAIKARGVELVFRSASDERDWDIAVAALDSSGDDEGTHRLRGSGRLRGTEFEIDGNFRSLSSLVNLDAVEHDLSLALGKTRLASAGTIAELATLTGLDVQTEFTIPSPDEITDLLGLPTTPLREFTGELTASPSSDLTAVRLHVQGPAAVLGVEGTIDSVLVPENADLSIRFAGPDIRPVGALVGAEDLPETAFQLTGAIGWQGFPIEVSGLEIEVGENRLTADGRLGRPPLMLGTDFSFDGAGPNIAAVAVLVGRRIPQDAFEIEGRLLRVDGGVQVDEISLSLGSTMLAAQGFVGDAPEYTGTELELDLRGTNLARFSGAIGLKLPDQPFRIGGRLGQGDGAIALKDVEATVGSGRVRVDGRLTTEAGLIGTDLRFSADGLDALHIGDLLGLDGLPSSRLRAEGGVSVTSDGYRPKIVRGSIADVDFSVDGLLTRNKNLIGSSLDINARGGDASIFSNLLPMVSLPREAFRVEGTLELLDGEYRFNDVGFEIGDASGKVDGILSTKPKLDGTAFRVDTRGKSLAVFDPLIAGLNLPAAEFEASGELTIDGGLIDLDAVSVDVAGNVLTIDGTVAPVPDLIGSSFDVSVVGPNIDSLFRMIDEAAGLDLPSLPEEPFRLTGEVAIDETGYHLPDASLSIASARVSVIGTLGHSPDFVGSDLEFTIDGPDASLINSVLDLAAPVEPFGATGRIAKEPAGFEFHQVELRLAGYRASLDGRLGKLPKLIGTSLTVDAQGPDLEPFRLLFGFDRIPSQPWRLAGRFDGDPQRFKTDGLLIRLGSSDLSGDVRIDLVDRPRALARLHSNHLAGSDIAPPSPESVDAADEPSDESRSFPIVSDEHWDLSLLQDFDLDLDWSIDRLEYYRAGDRDVEISLVLDDGRLEIDRLRATGELDGVVDGSASITPTDDGHRFAAELNVDNGMINLAGESADPSQYTTADLHVAIEGAGRSLHELMSSADGRAVLTVESGVMEKGLIDIISADVLLTVLNTLNPFAKEDNRTNINCAVLAVNFDDGVMKLEPAAIQTDKVTVLGDGTIDFTTEKIRFDWITKPRKGVGLSASMFTNPYIRLGGSLAQPQVEMKPAEALATTGVAVATMGISIVAKGLFDRVTAEKKVCEKAMKQVAKMDAEAPKR